MRYGIALGRFQPFHLKHLEYLLAAKARCPQLVVGITNPDTSLRVESFNDPHRSLPENNPFTYFERSSMVRDSLVDAGVERGEFHIVPAPLGTQTLGEYLPSPKEAMAYVTVYDDWGDERILLLERFGYAVEVIWRRTPKEKEITGTDVRRRILADEDWQSLVPSAVVPWVHDSLACAGGCWG